ncbi:MAG: lysophospholipid acyltransferase family protein [Gemmatimonadota bacterium]|nr:lysophospholipid acyltransferase family protein [Gemmatimonadota bacterium]
MSDAPSRAIETSPLGWRTQVAIRAGGVLLRLLSWTWRITTVGREEFESVRNSGRSVIITFWHAQILPHVVQHRTLAVVLISDHSDGEIITQIVRGYGLTAVRGSTSKGGARALLQLARTLKGGEDIAITPDGPRGPRHSFAPGALLLAERTGAPLMLMASHSSRVWRLKTWDQFEVPKPFARVTVIYAPPIYINAVKASEMPQEAENIAGQLNALVERAAQTASTGEEVPHV